MSKVSPGRSTLRWCPSRWRTPTPPVSSSCLRRASPVALPAKRPGGAPTGGREGGGRRPVEPPRHQPETDRRIHQLTRELEATRDYLQVVSEAHEAAQEELKSAHEEVLSANEEFHSTNEELETAKEELQSTNEELTTTNEELGHRNRELNASKEAETAARDYAEGIIETMSEPLLVLDGELRVMRANSAFYSCFKTNPAETEQVFLYDLGNKQWNIPRLRTLLEEILPRGRVLPRLRGDAHLPHHRREDHAPQCAAATREPAAERDDPVSDGRPYRARADSSRRRSSRRRSATESHWPPSAKASSPPTPQARWIT